MKRNIFDVILGGCGLQRASVGDSMIPIKGYWDVKVVRADGSVEEKTLENIVTANGLNLIADRLVLDANSKANWIAIGSYLSAPALDSSNFGEVVGGRKIAATVQQSREWAYIQATWGGAADGVTSDDLQQAAMCNHQTSGTGTVINIVEGLSTVLADSDFLNLTVRIRVGSHNFADT
jgi:hypothetical protein